MTSHHHNGGNSKSTLLLNTASRQKRLATRFVLDLFDELISNFPPFQTREVKESICLHPRRTVSFCGRLSRILILINSSHVFFHFISSYYFICCFGILFFRSIDNHEHRLRSTIIIKFENTSLVLSVQHHPADILDGLTSNRKQKRRTVSRRFFFFLASSSILIRPTHYYRQQL